MSIELLNALADLEPKALIGHEYGPFDTSPGTDLVIPGGSFSPSLTKQPIVFIVIDSDGNQLDVNHPTFELNGSVYDVTVQTTDGFTDLKIVALCKRS